MKRVGIMTFHRSHNCGSLLQAYALQKVLKLEFNIDSEFIDFSNTAQRELYGLFWNNNSLKKIIKNILYLFHFPMVKRHRNDYVNFIENRLTRTSKDYAFCKDLSQTEKFYSALITGSDQVWNIKCFDADDAYFLNFAKNIKKIAYAVSLGAINIIKYADDIQKYKKYLDDFDFISIREENGKKWISELTSRDVPICLDPTLLLDMSKWEELIDRKRLYNHDYILYYAFHYPDSINKVVNEISKIYDMPVIMLDGRSWIIKFLWRHKFKITRHSGPTVLLNLLKNATIVLTGSFHGTAFSVKFHKQFYFLKSNLHNKDDDRATYFMNQIKIASQFVAANDILQTNLFKPIDYSKADETINILKKKSFEFLNRALKE